MISLKGTESSTHAPPWVGRPAVRIHLADEQTRDRDGRKNVLPHSRGGSVEWLPNPLQNNLVSCKNYGICGQDCGGCAGCSSTCPGLAGLEYREVEHRKWGWYGIFVVTCKSEWYRTKLKFIKQDLSDVWHIPLSNSRQTSWAQETRALSRLES